MFRLSELINLFVRVSVAFLSWFHQKAVVADSFGPLEIEFNSARRRLVSACERITETSRGRPRLLCVWWRTGTMRIVFTTKFAEFASWREVLLCCLNGKREKRLNMREFAQTKQDDSSLLHSHREQRDRRLRSDRWTRPVRSFDTESKFEAKKKSTVCNEKRRKDVGGFIFSVWFVIIIDKACERRADLRAPYARLVGPTFA